MMFLQFCMILQLKSVQGNIFLQLVVQQMFAFTLRPDVARTYRLRAQNVEATSPFYIIKFCCNMCSGPSYQKFCFHYLAITSTYYNEQRKFIYLPNFWNKFAFSFLQLVIECLDLIITK